MKEWTVYMHISPNNKKYIGITSQKTEYRWHSDGSGYKDNNYFYNAIKKYGWDNFQHIIIVKGLSEDDAKWLEMELIKIWDTTNQEKGYNILSGGQTNNGKNNPFYGKSHTKESINKMKISHIGNFPNDETRKKISEMRKGEGNNMWGKRGELSPHWGKKYSEERKNNISKALGTSVRCIELDMEFVSLNKAEVYMTEVYNIKFSHKTLKATIDGNRKKDWYGEIEINGELVKLHWEYC